MLAKFGTPPVGANPGTLPLLLPFVNMPAALTPNPPAYALAANFALAAAALSRRITSDAKITRDRLFYDLQKKE